MTKCKICGSDTKSLGTVPFDRNNANVPIVNNTPIEYVQCLNCSSIQAPEMLNWTPEQLGAEVYNQDYIKYDPDYLDTRPRNYARTFMDMFSYSRYGKFSHLDYGSGIGLMSSILKSKTWNSTAFDPYSNNIRPNTKFDLITAIEVVEHSLDIQKTFEDMLSFLNKDGVIIFSTCLVPPTVDISWWYIGARNGHINIASEKAMKLMAKNLGMKFSSISLNMHILQKSTTSINRLIKGSFV